MFVSLLIILAALSLNPGQRAESTMLQKQIAGELGRVGRYESDLSVVMWNFVEVAHIVIDDDKLVVYFLGGWDPSILSQIFDYVRSDGDGERTLVVQERIVVSGQCPKLKEAVSTLTSRFRESLEWVPFEAEYPTQVTEDGEEIFTVDGASYEIRGRVKGGVATIRPDSVTQTPLYQATHEFFVAVRNCANSSPTERVFQHAF